MLLRAIYDIAREVLSLLTSCGLTESTADHNKMELSFYIILIAQRFSCDLFMPTDTVLGSLEESPSFAFALRLF